MKQSTMIRRHIVLCFLFFPLFVFFLTIFMSSFLTRMAPDWVATLHVAVVGYGFVSIVFPWVIERQLALRFQARGRNSDFWMLLVGLVFSINPALCGLFLFFGGITLVEVSLFAGASFLAALAWVLHCKERNSMNGKGSK